MSPSVTRCARRWHTCDSSLARPVQQPAPLKPCSKSQRARCRAEDLFMNMWQRGSVLALVAMLCSNSLDAMVVLPAEFNEMVTASQTIVQGRIVDVRSYETAGRRTIELSLIHISEPTRLLSISYA